VGTVARAEEVSWGEGGGAAGRGAVLRRGDEVVRGLGGGGAVVGEGSGWPFGGYREEGGMTANGTNRLILPS